MIPPKDELQLESIRRDVQSGLIDLLDPNLGGDFPDGDLRAHCEARVEKLVSRLGRGIDEEDRVRIATEVIADAFGLGPLDGLLEDELVTDILINAPDRIFIEKEGRLIRTGVGFRDEAHLMHVVQRLVRRSGRRLDERSPMVDARLPDGSRVNIRLWPSRVPRSASGGSRRSRSIWIDWSASARWRWTPPACSDVSWRGD